MRHRFYTILISVLSVVLLFGQTAALPQEKPLLSGRVLTTSGSSDSPLARAQIELLVPKTGEVRYTAYSDPRGGYAFRRVSPGQYDLRVRYGRVLEQETPKGWAELRRINLSSQPSRLIIRVRAR